MEGIGEIRGGQDIAGLLFTENSKLKTENCL
jgi:hypothetical protein